MQNKNREDDRRCRSAKRKEGKARFFSNDLKRLVRSQLATWPTRSTFTPDQFWKLRKMWIQRMPLWRDAHFEVTIHKTQYWNLSDRKSARHCGARRIAPFFLWWNLKKNGLLQNSFFFMWSTRGNEEIVWNKQIFYFANRRIDRETNSKFILYINKSIDKYILQEINWRANK